MSPSTYSKCKGTDWGNPGRKCNSWSHLLNRSARHRAASHHHPQVEPTCSVSNPAFCDGGLSSRIAEGRGQSGVAIICFLGRSLSTANRRRHRNVGLRPVRYCRQGEVGIAIRTDGGSGEQLFANDGNTSFNFGGISLWCSVHLRGSPCCASGLAEITGCDLGQVSAARLREAWDRTGRCAGQAGDQVVFGLTGWGIHSKPCVIHDRR